MSLSFLTERHFNVASSLLTTVLIFKTKQENGLFRQKHTRQCNCFHNRKHNRSGHNRRRGGRYGSFHESPRADSTRYSNFACGRFDGVSNRCRSEIWGYLFQRNAWLFHKWHMYTFRGVIRMWMQPWLWRGRQDMCRYVYAILCELLYTEVICCLLWDKRPRVSLPMSANCLNIAFFLDLLCENNNHPL